MRGFNRFHGLFRFLVLHIGIAAMNHRVSSIGVYEDPTFRK